MAPYKQYVKRKLVRKTIWQRPWIYLGILAGLIVLAIGLYQIPWVNDRAYFYVATTRSKIFYFFNPPGKVVFNPSEQGEMSPETIATLTAMAPTPTVTLLPTNTPTTFPTTQDTPTPAPTFTPTPTPPPPPSSARIDGVKWEKQGFNNCGPANLAMILSYWGDPITQRDTEKVLKPRKEDRNVMPYEMLNYALTQSPFGGVVRYGGNMDMLKRLVAAGFPVVIERGYMDAKEGWMGHYGLIYAYDDATQKVNIPDTYLGEITMSYKDVEMYWAQFDDIYLVIYPWEREQEVKDILGQHWDENYNKLQALEQVSNRIYNVEGRELFFAWYSRGSILVEMQDYMGAATAYDNAFEVYNTLVESQRPWRVTWYQTGPYFAYFYSGRYQDTLALAQKTISRSVEPAIPETFVWAGRASKMIGNYPNAIYYFNKALEWHPDWWVAKDELARMGETE
jgi:hypothetical protein